MEIVKKDNSKIFCITIKGSSSGILTPGDEQTIRELLDGDIALLLFDLSASAYLGSSALRVILTATKKIKRKHGRVLFASDSRSVVIVSKILIYSKGIWHIVCSIK